MRQRKIDINYLPPWYHLIFKSYLYNLGRSLGIPITNIVLVFLSPNAFRDE